MNQPVSEPASEAAENMSERLMVGRTEEATRSSISRLVQALAKPQFQAGSLEGVTRELLRPMLREWFDANLPQLVDRLVEEELRQFRRPT